MLLSLCLLTLSGVLQLAVAVATITLVLVTGIESILGLGPAIFLTAGALAALPAGRLMDRYGRVPVISGAFVIGAIGCVSTALGCLADSASLVILGFVGVGAMNGGVLLARTAAADMYPPDRKARAISYVLFGALFGAALGPLVFRPLFAGKDLELNALVVPWFVAAAMALVGLLLALNIRPDPRTIALELQQAGPDRCKHGAPGTAPGDSAPPGRSDGGHCGARQLRGDGRRDEPDRLHRGRAPPRPGRCLQRHQPPHRRDVRAGARDRRARGSRRTAPDAPLGPRHHGRLDRDARIRHLDPVDCRRRCSCSVSAGISRTSPRRRNS